jgi:excisionase family DNA binding protein
MINKFEHEFLSQRQASEYLGINFNTLYNWVSEGRVPVYKMGRFNKYKVGDLDKMFQLKK